jgi:acyl-CoA thioester hydrolase
MLNEKKFYEISTFKWVVRVYFEDTDGSGGVSNAAFLKFFERARTEWLRSLGVKQTELIKMHQMMFVLRKSTIEFFSSAKLDDDIELTVTIQKLGRASVQFKQQAFCLNETKVLLADGEFHVACINTSYEPISIPKFLVEKILSFNSNSTA